MGKIAKVMKLLNMLEKESSRGLPLATTKILEEIDIDRKTLSNYINEFKEAGIEVSSLTGNGGGYLITGMYLRPREKYALDEALKFLEENNFKYLDEFKGAMDTINYTFFRGDK